MRESRHAIEYGQLDRLRTNLRTSLHNAKPALLPVTTAPAPVRRRGAELRRWRCAHGPDVPAR